MDYSSAGVDLEQADEATRRIKSLAAATFTDDVIGKFGGFGGAIKFDTESCRDPVLISSCDGVGTKLKIAFMTGMHDTVGIDLVNHCVNDIAVCGARPLFFLDYIGIERVVPDVIEQIVKGFANGCSEAGIALLGEYDLVGFVVGAVSRESVLDGSNIVDGDVVVAFPSVGLHTNGYSLARRIFFEHAGWDVTRKVKEFGKTLGEELLVPHYCYLREIETLKGHDVKGIAHVTGGGVPGNLGRVIPDGLCARVEVGRHDIPAIFGLLQELGDVETEEMYRVFNMGIGLVAVLSTAGADELLADKTSFASPFVIGSITRSSEPVDMIYHH
jgi:phosphoribosylformylglycinamidine cyclo-ligase